MTFVYRSMLNIMVIVIGNEITELSSNLRQGCCISLCTNALMPLERQESICSPYSQSYGK